MNLIGCAFMPHPPIMVPEVGGEELARIEATVRAAEKVTAALQEHNPQTVIILTPHGPVFEDAACISIHPRLRGSLAAFGASDVSLGFETDGLLARHISKKCERLGVQLVQMTDEMAKSYRISLNLDHGATVPLYYLHKAGFRGQLIHLSMGLMPYEEMYTFGKAVQAAVAMTDKRVAVIASGDLSHRLTPDAPAGFSPQGAEFDRQVVAALKNADVKALLSLDEQLIAEAGECGLRPAFFLMGVMDGLDVAADVLSYEGPFGVGYAIAQFLVNGRKGECTA